MPTVLPLDELLSAPVVPPNVPPFKLIRSSEFALSRHHSHRNRYSDDEDEDEEDEDDFSTLEEVFPCDCTGQPGHCCGPEAKCINRELFIECPQDECPCGDRCENQRFTRREYATVKVVETPGKGFGLFTCEDLKP